MPYDGEYASYRPLQRIAEAERVRSLLGRARTIAPGPTAADLKVRTAPPASSAMPDFVVAIDGSTAEVDVKTGYPGAKVGYCTVASVLLNLKQIEALDQRRPANPVEFRKTEETATVDAALPGANVVIRTHNTAKDSFREALYEVFHDEIIDEEDGTRLLDTYEALLALKPKERPPNCPYEADGCEMHFNPGNGITSCPCSHRRAIYSTDALRIHERFHDSGTNGEAYGEVMQVWERLVLVHLLRCFERRGWITQFSRVAFFIDGPLAVFGHPAWLSAAIKTELKRLNGLVRAQTSKDLMILGIEKSGAFAAHFDEIDVGEDNTARFNPRSFILPTDKYIKERIIFSTSEKRYGIDTYFGRKLFYKTSSGARLVADIPFLTDEQDTLETDDGSEYPDFQIVCGLLDKLVSSRYPNSLSPIISAHAQAAIPLQLGAKVLQQLARALMRKE